MNKNGEQVGIGGFIGIAIIAIVGAILLVGSAQNMHNFRNTVAVENATISSVNGTHNAFGQANTSAVTIYNGTGDVIVGVGNWTFASNQVVNGVLTATLTVAADSIYQGEGWNISYTAEPDGYSTSGAARSMGQIILIFFGFGIAIVMLVPTLRNKVVMSFTR